jgi:hypothetical protein
MSVQHETIEETKEVEDDDVDDEEPPTNAMTSHENTAKIDINAWRKRRSIAYQRNPLMFRRMSRGEHLAKTCY